MSERIALSIVSHTNVGKTTLARTLLRRDVGEVLDQAHVTVENERHLLLETDEGDALLLWDTPGFGDSRRLLRRLKQHSKPILWLLGQAWDRVTNLPLWCSREAARNLREEADVVLYLVNAAEDPEATGYVGAEAEILAWIGKPTLLLLNQTGLPADPAHRSAAEERWWRFVASQSVFRGALRLDAFTRCWVEEGILLERVAGLLPPEKKQAMARIVRAWQDRNRATFEDAVDEIVRLLAVIAADRESLSEALPSTLATRRAESRLRVRCRSAISTASAALIRLHGLEGTAADDVAARLGDVSDPGTAVDPMTASLWGGVLSGAAGGLAADLSTGGLSFGAGVMLGAIAGGLGAGGGAWAYRQIAGPGEPLRWTDEFLERQAIEASLRYLSVAHYGRGAGAYREREFPSYWREKVTRAASEERSALAGAWRAARDEGCEAAEGRLRPIVRDVLVEVLKGAYPSSAPFTARVPS